MSKKHIKRSYQGRTKSVFSKIKTNKNQNEIGTSEVNPQGEISTISTQIEEEDISETNCEASHTPIYITRELATEINERYDKYLKEISYKNNFKFRK